MAPLVERQRLPARRIGDFAVGIMVSSNRASSEQVAGMLGGSGPCAMPVRVSLVRRATDISSPVRCIEPLLPSQEEALESY